MSIPPQAHEATRRRLSERRAATVARLAGAAIDELAASGYEALTVRGVARRAGVSPATAYTYFTSKAHLVAEVFWRRLAALPDPPAEPALPGATRVAAALRDLATMVASEPQLAAACAPALLGADPDVAVLRDRIGAELHRRLLAAVTGGGPATAADAEAVAALDFMVAGALLRAGMGHMSYGDLADRLAALAPLVVGDRP
ncbi:MAG TPA: helix-turn-helix domain-containing protein [Acidimicrobiales bacterium]